MTGSHTRRRRSAAHGFVPYERRADAPRAPDGAPDRAPRRRPGSRALGPYETAYDIRRGYEIDRSARRH